MGKLVGLTFPEPPAKAAKANLPLAENPFAAKYKRMKTPELNALLEERGIEVPEKANNPMRVALLAQADEAEVEKAEAEG